MSGNFATQQTGVIRSENMEARLLVPEVPYIIRFYK